MHILSAVLTLFLIMDPLGNIPVFLAVLRDVPAARRRRVLIREVLLAYVVLLAFLFLGQYLLNVLHLRSETISISGGIVLFLIALRMIFPQEGGVMGTGNGFVTRRDSSFYGKVYAGVRAGFEATTPIGPIRVEEGFNNAGTRALLVRLGYWF